MDSRDQGEIGGAIQGGTVYASPDFQDIDIPGEVRPQNSVLTAVSNVVLYHISEAAEKQYQAKQWRKKIREMLHYHQEKILQFFTKPLPSEHPLKAAHTLLNKYGKPIVTDITKTAPPQFFKDYITEAPQEGAKMLNTYISELEASRSSDTPIQKWQNMSRHMLEYMRDTGDELLRLDQRLQTECQHIDSVVEKVTQLVSLPNPEIQGFQEMMDTYIEKQFELHPIHVIYWDYIYTLQKYSILRDILLPQRAVTQTDPLCCICMTEPIVIAVGPCGHTFCANCSKKTIICHFCRRAITSRLRIYFS